MQIDDNLLQKLEKLSSLKIADDKRAMIIEQLNEIVAYIDHLDELDLANQDYSDEGINPLRDDIINKSNVIDSILLNAPKSENRFFIVPKIIE